MNFKMKHSDFDELTKYINLKAKGSSLEFKVSLEGNLEIKVIDMNGDQVIVTIFPEDMDYFPRINKTYRLQEEIKK